MFKCLNIVVVNTNQPFMISRGLFSNFVTFNLNTLHNIDNPFAVFNRTPCAQSLNLFLLWSTLGD